MHMDAHACTGRLHGQVARAAPCHAIRVEQMQAAAAAAGLLLYSALAHPAPPCLPPAPGQQGALGLNLLCDERCAQYPGYNTTRYRNRRAESLQTIRRHPDLTLAGPYWLTQGGFGGIARLP